MRGLNIFVLSGVGMIKTVLFDLDGTLADSMENICSLIMRVMSELRLPAVRRSVIKRVVSKPEELAFKELFPKHTHLIGKARKIYMEYYLEFLPSIREIPNARKTLFRLHDMGIKIGITTVKLRPLAVKAIEHLGIFCDILVAFEDTRFSRPNPYPLVKAMKELKVNPGEALYVGDTPEDIIQGRAAKVRTIAIPTGMFKRSELQKENPDFMIRDLSEIPEIINRLK